MQHALLTDKILESFFIVFNKLGYGFLEKVYENAIAIELLKHNLEIKQQMPIKVFYDKQVVGEYFADIIINDSIILELKAAEALRVEHVYQLTNYLKSTQIEVGLLLNFGKKPEFKRVLFTNDKK